jgi:hypothetical protein
MKILAPISIGELYDKVSILEIKLKKIKDLAKLEHIKSELVSLNQHINKEIFEEALFSELKQVNLKLWEIEDEIRIYEKNKNFGKKFVELARSVYVTNDQRFELKNRINSKFNSFIVEEKSYEKY